jgi:hypothetical protein
LGLLNTKALRHKGGFYIRVEVNYEEKKCPGVSLFSKGNYLSFLSSVSFVPLWLYHKKKLLGWEELITLTSGV